MPLTLHAAVIPGFQQLLGAVNGLLDKGEAFVAERNLDEEEFLQSRLVDDMLPLAYQFKSCWVHTAAALQSLREGQFSPEMTPPPGRLDPLRKMVLDGLSACEQMGENELEAMAGNDFLFTIGDRLRLQFTVQDFLLSFTQPNLYFHAATSYDIMRMRGVPVGKRDFLGAMRVKQGASG